MAARRRIEAADVGLAAPGAKRAHKYGALPTLACERCGAMVSAGECPTCGGQPVRFDSKAEARAWQQLVQAQQAGVIRDLTRQTRYDLRVNGVLVGIYYADFEFRRLRVDEFRRARETHTVVDVKGVDTRVSRIKRRLLWALHGVVVEVWKNGECKL